MTFHELHDLLTRECDLLPEPEHGGAWRTYYFKKIDRHPATSTRTAKVFLTQGDTPFKIRLCASSDNNNSVFLNSPFDADALKTAIKAEIELLPGKNTSNH